MPTYQYKCSNHPEDKNHEYEETRLMNDPTPEDPICKIEGCDGKLLRIFGAPPIIFNGIGFSAKRG
jgi:predicted nucleic acid-binding Zn ribbon protein